MAFSELSVERDTIGRFSEKRGSQPEVSLARPNPPTLPPVGSPGSITVREFLDLPEPDTAPRTAPLHTSDDNRALFEERKELAEAYELAVWYDGGSPQGIDYLYRYQKPLLDFDADHPEIAQLGTRTIEPTPEIRPVQARDENGKKTWSVDGPDGLTLSARKVSLFGGYTASYSTETGAHSWEGRSPEEALAAAYSGVQTDEVREARIAALSYDTDAASIVRDLRYKMGQITASERNSRLNNW